MLTDPGRPASAPSILPQPQSSPVFIGRAAPEIVRTGAVKHPPRAVIPAQPAPEVFLTGGRE
jgi:hypothetical protein